MDINSQINEQTLKSILQYLSDLEWIELNNEPDRKIKLRVLPELKESSIDLTISVESVVFESYPEAIAALLMSSEPEESRKFPRRSALRNFFYRLRQGPRAVFSLSTHQAPTPEPNDSNQHSQVSRLRKR